MRAVPMRWPELGATLTLPAARRKGLSTASASPPARVPSSAAFVAPEGPYRCPNCGIDAACDCGVAPVPAGKRAEAAVAANPEKSNVVLAASQISRL